MNTKGTKCARTLVRVRNILLASENLSNTKVQTMFWTESVWHYCRKDTDK